MMQQTASLFHNNIVVPRENIPQFPTNTC